MQFRKVLINWMKSINQLSNDELIAIDGNVLRSSNNMDDWRTTIPTVSAYACASKVVIGQRNSDIKYNEITMIPKLVKWLDIKGF